MVTRMAFLNEGDPAPDFTLPKAGGGCASLNDFRGSDVILYFYPKDDTPGCTKQACDLRDAHADLAASGAVVVGISTDDVASHDRFASKYGLPFILLSDIDHKVADAYGAWAQKSMYGRTYMGIQRSTYLIDREGTISRVWPHVKASEHLHEVRLALGLPIGA
jgi:peroxiredoxin Q/BCP